MTKTGPVVFSKQYCIHLLDTANAGKKSPNIGIVPIGKTSYLSEMD